MIFLQVSQNYILDELEGSFDYGKTKKIRKKVKTLKHTLSGKSD